VRKTENETYVERRKALIENIEDAIKRVESEIREKFYKKVVFKYNDLAYESKCLLDTYRSDLEYFHFNVKSGGLLNNLGKFIMLNSRQSFQFQHKEHLVLFRLNNAIHTEGGVTTKESIDETDFIFLKKSDYETREMTEEEKNKYIPHPRPRKEKPVKEPRVKQVILDAVVAPREKLKPGRKKE
jgi:hypothetical protein